jgi:hypothetical protein
MSFPVPSIADPLVSPDYAGWWSRGITLLSRCLGQLLAVHLVGAVVTIVVQVPLTLLAVLMAYRTNSVTLAILLATLVPLIVRVGVQAVATVAGVHLVVAAAAGVPPRVGRALGYAARRALPLLTWQCVAVVVLLVAVVALVIPALYVGLVVLLLPTVVAFERDSAALGRCFRLFHASVGTALARTLTLGAIWLVGSVGAFFGGDLVAGIIEAAVLGDTDLTIAVLVGAFVGTVVATFVGAAVAVFTTPLLVTTYADLRGRAEGTTTVHLAAAVGLHANGS